MKPKQRLISALYHIASAGLILSSSPAGAQAQQGTILGNVTEREFSEPLPNANVTLAGTVRGTTTGLDGTFELRVPAGKYTLQATYIGYQSAVQSVVVSAGDTGDRRI